jgi:protein-tyrosine phosphatase
LSSAIRALARTVRHAPDRVAHPWRRARARARVGRASPRRLLVLCLGNICRSPYAERRLRSLLGDLEVRSAGLLEAGRPPPALALQVAREHGIDLSEHRSIQLPDEWLGWADLVLVMNRRQAAEVGARCVAASSSPLIEWLGDFDPERIERRALRDPFDQDRPVFEAVYGRIDACCRSIAGVLRGAG